MLATLDDLKRNLIYAGGKITFGSGERDTMTEADALLFLEDSLALMEQKHEDVEGYSDEVRRLVVRVQCLETFIMMLNAYNKDVNMLNSLQAEIERIERMMNDDINYAYSYKGYSA